VARSAATAERKTVECHSFDPSTRVLLADGSAKEIGRVELGDEVLSTDPMSGETTAEPVTWLYRNQDFDLTDPDMVAADGRTETVRTTWTHPFWDATDGRWVRAADLVVGHELAVIGDEPVRIGAVRNRVGDEEMRDLTVANIHTYYVLAAGAPVLVHNCEVEYGSTDLSKAVQEQRIKDNNAGNNYAAAKYTDADGNPRIVVRRSSAGRGNHAEVKIMRDIDP
jgi:hypothetical protein